MVNSNPHNFKYTVETPRLFNSEVFTDDLEKQRIYPLNLVVIMNTVVLEITKLGK